MKLKALRQCEWPTGTHWAAGEVRTVDVPKGTEIPPLYLVEVKAKAKAKTTKDD